MSFEGTIRKLNELKRRGTTKPLFRDVVEPALTARLDNVRVKVATPEHLILLLQEAHRPKDRLRIPYLLEAADDETLTRLLERFDDEQGNLAKKLEAIRERGL
jgi:hypothetical protein